MPDPRGLPSPFHAVCLYRGGELLHGAVAVYLADGFLRNAGALVVASAEHQAGISAALQRLSFSITMLRAAGQLTLLDAQSVLDRISVNDVPDPLKLRALIRDAVGPVRGTAGNAPCSLRIYSEMTELLHERGQDFAARRLEKAWDDCVADQPSDLLCGQRDDRITGLARRQLCGQHTHVIGANGLPHPASGARSPGFRE